MEPYGAYTIRRRIYGPGGVGGAVMAICVFTQYKFYKQFTVYKVECSTLYTKQPSKTTLVLRLRM